MEAQSDVVEMAHTALGHLDELKKKELVLAAMTMSNEEFDRLVAQRNQLIVESTVSESAVSENTPSNAPIPPPNLTATTGDTASIDTSEDGGGVVGGEDGL